jgi:integrase/recombinase XerD
VRPPQAHKLPVILRAEDVHTIRQGVRLPRYRACLTTLDACGLRLHEGTPLQMPDIARARMLIHVRCGTGAKDRSGPLPHQTLEGLRQSWKTHRHPVGLCPAPGRSGVGMSTASTPLPRHRVQDACRAALTASGIHPRASGHTLRHAWATPLLEAGVHLRLIQHSLGPPSPSTTALSPPLTANADALATEALPRLLGALAFPREIGHA